jgi:hypothetical protein
MPNNLYMFPCMTPLQSGNKKPEVATLRWLDQSNYQEMKHHKGSHIANYKIQ